jgi:hypothetical protein
VVVTATAAVGVFLGQQVASELWTGGEAIQDATRKKDMASVGSSSAR